MRAAYHSEYRPGALDTSELDPCIAAETRLKKSALSTSKKRALGLIAAILLGIIVLVILLLCFLPGRPATRPGPTVDGVDYDIMDSPTPKPLLAHRPPPATTTTTTVAETGGNRTLPSTKTTRRPSTTRLTPTAKATLPSSSSPSMGKEIVIGRDEQPMQIQRVSLPVQPVQQPASTTTTTTATPVTQPAVPATPATTRQTLRTRPSSVFPTAPLRAGAGAEDEEPVERKTEVVRESCSDHATAALGSGVYRILPEGGEGKEPFDVYCRMDEDDVMGEAEGVFRAGAAWTYVQSLSEEAYFYNRTFAEYQAGIGRVDRSHWLGLDALHALAPHGSSGWERPAVLRIELYGDSCAEEKQCSGRPDGFWWGEWEFGLAPADDLYRLHIAPATHGNLTVHTPKDVFYEMNNGQQFTTADRDNDSYEAVNCGQTRNYGGWWHKDCTLVALNGMYGDFKSTMRYQVWYRATMAGDPLKSSYYIHPRRSIMMVRPRV